MDSVKFSNRNQVTGDHEVDSVHFNHHDNTEAQFEFVFNKYYTALCFYANSIIQDEEESKDIVQECFTKLWTNPRKIQNHEAVPSFLYVAVRNLCIDGLRKRKLKKGAEGKLRFIESSDEAEFFDELVFAELVRKVTEHINQLPEDHQNIIRMYFTEGKKYTTIATYLNSTADAVRKKNSRALQVLRSKIILPIFLLILKF